MRENLLRPDREFHDVRPYKPTKLLREIVAGHPRRIENCWWFRKVQIDIDFIPLAERTNPYFTRLTNDLEIALKAQGHLGPSVPSNRSDMIIACCHIPQDGDLMTRVPEVNPPILINIPILSVAAKTSCLH